MILTLLEDDVAGMEMEDDLRKLKLPKDKDPKELHTDTAAIEIQYKCKMTKIRKVAIILPSGTKDYTVIIPMTSTTT